MCGGNYVKRKEVRAQPNWSPALFFICPENTREGGGYLLRLNTDFRGNAWMVKNKESYI